LRGMMDHMVSEGFVRASQRSQVWFGDDENELFDWMQGYQVQHVLKKNDGDGVKV